MLAAEKGNIEIINHLLERKIGKINAKDSQGRTALFFAVNCDQGENTDLVLQLLGPKGCNVNSECRNKETPLLRAVAKGYINIVKILLDEGAYTRASLENTGKHHFLAKNYRRYSVSYSGPAIE